MYKQLFFIFTLLINATNDNMYYDHRDYHIENILCHHMKVSQSATMLEPRPELVPPIPLSIGLYRIKEHTYKGIYYSSTKAPDTINHLILDTQTLENENYQWDSYYFPNFCIKVGDPLTYDPKSKSETLSAISAAYQLSKEHFNELEVNSQSSY